ncbi:RHS repeat-associated core domain-containing protein [Ekhidna sp.]|uniref:RHS repeat-associated core domain-containing protein n=1 Tax=Ekhidna sp. TaxID=2608089 RepID=UPI003BAB46BC
MRYTIFTFIFLVSLSAFSQGSVSVVASLGETNCPGVELTYSASVSNYTGPSSCINYQWSVSNNGTVTGYSSNQSSIDVIWASGSTSGTVSVTVTSGDGGFEEEQGPSNPIGPGEPESSCPFLLDDDSKVFNLGSVAQGNISSTNSHSGIFCPGSTAQLSASVTGDAVFLGWYKNDNRVSQSLNYTATSAGTYQARAQLSSTCVNETITSNEYLSGPSGYTQGTPVGDRTVYKGKKVSGDVRVINSNAKIDRWRIKRGNNDWETYKTVPSNTSGIHVLNYIDEIFNETTLFKARVKQDCSGNPAEFLPTITINVIEYIADYHSITTTAFDNEGIIGKSASYFDNAGKSLQSQSLSPETDEIFASEPLVDNYDRVVGQTLSAPIGRNSFGFKEDFITVDGNKINESDWSGANPKIIDKSEPNTLGHYYSSNNASDDGLIPETSYPYTVSNYYENGSGEQKTSTLPGDHHFLESGNNGIQKTLPVLQGELRYYSELRNLIVGQGGIPERLVKQVAIDANGNEAIIYKNDAGHTIATAISGGPKYAEAVTHTNNGAWIEIHIPKGQARSFNTYEVVDLVSGNTATGTIGQGLYKMRKSSGTLSYKLTYTSFTYNFYDNKGRLVASMTPMGTQQIISQGGIGSIVGVTDLPYTTLYEYDFRGRLASMTEPDAGTSRFKYRKDGQIRFSQNAYQASFENGTKPRFSYTEYDQLGRPIESGEFIEAFDVPSADKLKFSGQEITTLLNKTGTTAQITSSRRFDWIKTYYDVGALPSLPSNFSGEFALAQEFVAGAVSSTESEDVQTWYSYDELGRVTWFLQHYKELDKHFLIQYEYDFLGNVTKVAFQPQTYGQQVSEAFWHYYTYDKNQRLKTVETSVHPDNEKYLHATYEYYAHGPLKRVVLAEDLQGIDYAYTPQGWLKAINHPVRSHDPGGDGSNGVHQDFFGMTLEYYEGDYARSDKQIGSLDLDDNQIPQQFNGNIRATIFGEGTNGGYSTSYEQAKFYNRPASLNYKDPLSTDLNKKAEKSITLTDGFNSNGHSVSLQITPDVPASTRTVDLEKGEVYAYQYDEKYQLKTADYTADGSVTNKFDVSVDGYDENGNIKGIDRYGDNPNSLRDNFKFHYDDEVDPVIIGTELDDADNIATNRLLKVDNYIDRIHYNEIGQVTGIEYTDPERTDIEIYYNVSGKVTDVWDVSVPSSPELIISFAYDDRGFRMMKKIGEVEEWYVRDASGQVMAIYHRDVNPSTSNLPAQIELPIYGATKLGMAFKNPDHYKYIYELTDHLGNVRAIATKLGVQATASMEPKNNTHESQYFDNLTSSRQKDVTNAYRGTHMAHLDETQPIGPTTTLRVKQGDQINLEVFVKYDDAANPSTVASGLSDLLDNHVNDAAVGVEGGSLTTAAAANLAAVLSGVGSGNGQPKAYIQYVLFNEVYEMVGSDYVAVENGVAVSGNADWKQVTLTGPVTEDGFLFAYLVNESNLDVFFDDFTFSIIGNRMIRATDYYPFGAVAKVWQNPEQTQQEPYRHGYQGQYAEQDTTTGWNAFQLRMFDPLIGRWLQVDPYRQFSSSYIGMGNNPIKYTDPDGGCVDADKNPIPCPKGVEDGMDGFHTTILDEFAITTSRMTEWQQIRYDMGLNILQRQLIKDPSLNSGVNRIVWSGYYRRDFNSFFTGYGVEANLYIGLGGGVSIDRIQDSQGGNDLYISFSGGYGADISAEMHGSAFDHTPGPDAIVGGSYFWGAAYGPVSYQRSGTMQYSSETGLTLGRYYQNQVGLGVGTPYLVGGGKGGLTYTINLSDIARYFQGYQTRSYHE